MTTALKCYRRQFYRERRRMAVAVALTLAAGHFGTGLVPDPFVPVSAEVVMILLAIAAIPLVSLRYSAQRHWIEIFALGNFLMAAAGSLFPAGLFGWHNAIFLAAFQLPAYALAMLGLRHAIYGRWSDAFTAKRPIVATTTLRSRLSPAELWYGLMPTPGHADRNPDPEVVSIEYADASRAKVRLVTWLPPQAGAGEILITYDEARPMHYARFRARVTRGPCDRGAEGETEIWIEDRGRSRRVRVRHRVNGFTPRRAVISYLDDTLGRVMQSRLNAIEARAAGRTDAKSQVRFDSWFNEEDTVAAGPPPHDGYRTAYGRPRSADETRALRALGKI